MTWMGATSLLSVKMNISSLSLTHDKVTPVWSRAGPTAFSSHQLSGLFGFNSHVQTHLQWHMCTELREQSWDVRRLRRHGCVVYCNFHAQNMPPIINYWRGGCCKTMNELPFEQENIWKVVWFNYRYSIHVCKQPKVSQLGQRKSHTPVLLISSAGEWFWCGLGLGLGYRGLWGTNAKQMLFSIPYLIHCAFNIYLTKISYCKKTCKRRGAKMGRHLRMPHAVHPYSSRLCTHLNI